MDRAVQFRGVSIPHTDIVRTVVILSLSLCCIFITALSLQRQMGPVYTQLFYFPIIYATYFYPRRGLIFSGACSLVYEILSYYYVYPNPVDLISTTAQAILFVLVALVVAYFTEKVNTSEARYRSIFESSLMGIILFDQNTFGIRMVNDCATLMLGYAEEELRGRRFSELFATPDEQRVFFERLGSSADISNFETRFRNKAGEPVWVALSWRRITENMVSCSILDIDTRKLAEHTAQESSARYQQVTENSPTGIIMLRDGKIAYTNPAFTGFSGSTPAELAGKDLLTLVHEKDRAEFFRFISAKGDMDAPAEIGECRFIAKNGEERLGAIFLTHIVQQDEPALLINLVDITEREKLKERIEKDKEQRRGIISSVAHELRTPLQPIMGYLNLLTQDPQTYGVTDETRAILDRCAKSVDRESQIINQMLELSTLEGGKNPLSYTTFNLAGMLTTIVGTGGYDQKADLTIDAPAEVMIEADESKLATVVDSMLSNAVNYSKPPRKIRVGYQFSHAEQMHKISIQDNGVGITNTQLDEIFEPFNLSDAGGMKKRERVGLSLSIAKKYVQMHGGYITVDSIVNLGSTFTIHIPKTPAPVEAMQHA